MAHTVKVPINDSDLNMSDSNSAEAYSQYVTYRISQLNARLTAQATRLLKSDSGLSVVRWRILALINASAPITSATLIKSIAMDAGLFSRNLKALISEGLVESTKNTDDQRQQMLTLTPAGTALFQQAAPAMNKRRERLTADIATDDLNAFFRVLGILEQRAMDT